MSIQDVLADRVQERRLFEVIPLLNPRRARSVWAAEDVLRQLDPQTANDDFQLEAGRLRRKLDDIVTGQRLVVGERREKHCDLKQLDPKRDEIWEIRERDDPSIRVFFRFVERDCFVATNVRLVKHLFEKLWTRNGRDFWPVWRAEIRRCKATWRNLFLTYQPHSGADLHDYLTNAIRAGSL